MATDVYVCYSAADQKVAEKLTSWLEGHGIRCWIAPRNIRLGEAAEEAALAGIHDSTVVLVVFSPAANDSPTVLREVEAAVRADKILIPFRIENAPPTGPIEIHFRRRYWHEAHTLPLEKHFEELVRMLKPLTRQRQTFTADEAELSRTLPSRSSTLRRSGSLGAPASGESAGPLQVSFHFQNLTATGRASVCACQVENRGAGALDQVEVILESRAFKRPAAKALPHLPPGSTQRLSLGLEALRSGSFPLQVSVSWIEGRGKFVAFGSRSISIAEAPTSAELMRRTQALPARQEDNASSGDPAPDLPGTFDRLDLKLDYQVSVENLAASECVLPLEIPAPLLGKAHAGNVLKLEPMESSKDAPFQEICLVSKTSFNLGRSQEDCDFLLWFWPRNEVHDTKTRRISKKHCTLSVDKGKCHIRNTAAASLTTFDSQDLSGPEGVPLGRRGVLNLSGIYALEVTHLPATCPSGPTIVNLKAWKEAAVEPSGIVTPGGGVRFTPQTPNVLPQHAVWLLSDGTFGTSRVNLIVLDSVGLADLQGRFHHHRGHFWIETLVDNGVVQLDGLVLKPGFIAPLAGGQTLQLGDRRYYLRIAG